MIILLFALLARPDFDVGSNCQEVHNKAHHAYLLPYTEVTLTEALEHIGDRKYLRDMFLDVYERPRHFTKEGRDEAQRRYAERAQIECIRRGWDRD